MNSLHTVGQKLTGKAQQVKGKIEVKSGQRVRGSIDQIKGKANEIGADIQGKAEDSKY